MISNRPALTGLFFGRYMARPIRLYCVAKRLLAIGIVFDGTGALVKLPVKHFLNASSFAVRSAGVSFVRACVFDVVFIASMLSQENNALRASQMLCCLFFSWATK